MLHNLSEEHLIRGYLLGELPETEQDLIEERVLADPEFLEESEIIEGELVDDYVMGLLSEADRTKLESGLLRSPEQHRRVRLIQMLGEFSLANIPGRDVSQDSWERLLSEAQANRTLLFSLMSDDWLGLRILDRLNRSHATRRELAAEFGTEDDKLFKVLTLLTKSGLVEGTEDKLACSWFGLEMLQKVEALSDSGSDE